MNAQQLRAARHRLGLSQAQFARKIGFKGKNKNLHVSISRLENGHRKISGTVETIVKILERKEFSL